MKQWLVVLFSLCSSTLLFGQNSSLEYKTLFDAGFASLKAKEYTKAIEQYSKAITLDPKNAQGYLYRGIAYHKIGSYSDLKKAIDEYSQSFSACCKKSVDTTRQVISSCLKAL
jgi:tetratricopeptide (TPR) repeat protein